MQSVGFIFDLDGVITDTAEYHYQSWKRLAEEEGLNFTREDNEALRGVSRRESLLLVLKGQALAEDQMQNWMERKNNYYLQFLDRVTPDDLLPGVGEFLRSAKAREIPLGLASASRNALVVCTQLGILDLFDAFVDGFTVKNTKPAVDAFMWAAGRLNRLPGQCVVFEDSEAGVEAARIGGFWSIGIGPVERVGRADRVVDGFDQLSVDEVVQMLG